MTKTEIDAMSVPALIAYVLGNRHEQMVRDAVASYGGRTLMPGMTPDKIATLFGVPYGLSYKLYGLVRLSELFYCVPKGSTIRSANDVFSLCQDMLPLRVEILRGFFLDARNRVLHAQLISMGNWSSNMVDVKEICKIALEHCAHAIILVHNHPSGISKPSDEDIVVSNKVAQGCATMDMSLLDHVIVGSDGFTSLQEMGCIMQGDV